MIILIPQAVLIALAVLLLLLWWVLAVPKPPKPQREAFWMALMVTIMALPISAIPAMVPAERCNLSCWLLSLASVLALAFAWGWYRRVRAKVKSSTPRGPLRRG